MKGPQLERFAKRYVLPHLPRFVAHKRLVVRPPIDWVLLGFHADASAFDQSFYLHALRVPLYNPHRGLDLTYSPRIGRTSRIYDVDPADPEPGMARVREAMVEQGLPLLDELATVEQMANFYVRVKEDHARAARMPNFWRELGAPSQFLGCTWTEPLAYSLILAGRFDEAAGVLGEARRQFTYYPPVPDDRAWVREAFARMGDVETLLNRSPALAIDKLREYRRYTLSHSKLEQFALPDDELPVPTG